VTAEVKILGPVAVLATGLALAVVALAAPGASGARTELTKCKDVEVTGRVTGNGDGPSGPVTHIRVFNDSCQHARALIRYWVRQVGELPQDQNQWFCARELFTTTCSFGNGGGAPFFRFILIPPSAAGDGQFFEESADPNSDIPISQTPLGIFEFAPCNWPTLKRRCRAQVTVDDQHVDSWSVFVELWWGGRLRRVCWDTHGARSPEVGSCLFNIRKGTPITFFLAEGDKPIWRKCWHRVKRTKTLVPTINPWCAQPIHGNGKRAGYEAGPAPGPNNIGARPPGYQGGIWGEGTFWGRA
jgi:hypothetical protein